MRQEMTAQNYQYRVTSKWCGFFGGWGSESDIARHIETETTSGWQLVRTESKVLFWFWFLPRPKVLFIYERTA